MMFLGFALCYIAGVAGCVVLVLHGHPWMAALVLLATSGIKLTWK